MGRLSSTLLASAAVALLCAPRALAQSANCVGSGAPPGALGGPVRVGVTPPPPLPPEEQPPAPGYGYMWTPGYWGWNTAVNDYYWIPGAWSAPPAIGLYWTPPWWAWDGTVFAFQPGYWGPTVGFYGGLDYGYGYFGHGYDGGYWRGRTIYYNRIYNNLGGLRVNAVYQRRALADRGDWRRPRPSYSGGRGGVVATASAAEIAARRQAHVLATAAQARRWAAAASDRSLRAGVNGGRPRLAAAHTPGPAADLRRAPGATPSPRHVDHSAPVTRHGEPIHPATPGHARAPTHGAAPGHHPIARPQRAYDRPHRFDQGYHGPAAHAGPPPHRFEAPVMRAEPPRPSAEPRRFEAPPRAAFGRPPAPAGPRADRPGDRPR